MDLHSLPIYLQEKGINKEFGTKTSIYGADIQEDLFFEKNVYVGRLKTAVENPSLTQMMACEVFAFSLSTMSRG